MLWLINKIEEAWASRERLSKLELASLEKRHQAEAERDAYKAKWFQETKERNGWFNKAKEWAECCDEMTKHRDRAIEQREYEITQKSQLMLALDAALAREKKLIMVLDRARWSIAQHTIHSGDSTISYCINCDIVKQANQALEEWRKGKEK
jgi:hypothetical protein